MCAYLCVVCSVVCVPAYGVCVCVHVSYVHPEQLYIYGSCRQQKGLTCQHSGWEL